MPGTKRLGVVTDAIDRRQESRERAGRQPLELEEVYRAHARDVWRWARRLGGPALDSEDVVQEVFLVAHRKLAGFRGEASVRTWLYRITARVVQRRRRKERMRRWLGGSATDVAGGLPTLAPGPAEQLDSRRAEASLYAAMEGLKPRSREVLALFELEGLSGEQIAELLGAKVATVWVWLHRARAELGRALEAQGEGAP